MVRMCGTEQIAGSRGVFEAEVTANDRICLEHYRLCIRLGEFPPTVPGQFVQLQCRPLEAQVGWQEADWPPDRPPTLRQGELVAAQPLLRRPFSLAGRRDADGHAELDIIYRVIGAGTGWLAGVRPTNRLSVLGPLGNGFAIRPDAPAAAIVGGGVGIPPMIYLAEALRRAGKGVTAFCGARSGSLLPLRLREGTRVPADVCPTPCAEPLAGVGVESVIATDDGSLGVKGLVSEALERWLGAQAAPAERMVVYCCGPEEMMRAVGDTCIAAGIECQLAMERHMACGMGTCQSCVVKIRDDSPAGWAFKLCCTDGPVFDARNVVWE